MRCKCCNHHIWVQESVEREMGPVCSKNAYARLLRAMAEDIQRTIRQKRSK